MHFICCLFGIYMFVHIKYKLIIIMNKVARHIENDELHEIEKRGMSDWRKSMQPLLPHDNKSVTGLNDTYNPTPFHSLGAGKIFDGYQSLATWIVRHKNVIIDGYGGVFFEDIYQDIQAALSHMGLTVNWIFTKDYFKSNSDIELAVAPFLGSENEVWGSKTNLELGDFFGLEELQQVKQGIGYDINIVIGVGAGLINWEAPVVYFELPKNEIQYRMRSESICNIGCNEAGKPFNMYKRFYFVDWVVLNEHRNKLQDRVTVVADGQRVKDITWMFNDDLAEGLKKLSHSVIRARPWFESGSWGGQWMKDNLSGLNQQEVNYGWSFELISPENGLILESDGILLEIPFDLLMLFESQSILGKHASQFGTYFPIRFDFLDTFSGGNLSIQCHPSKSYIKEKFGEEITQDETYYIMDCKPDAKVYLGFQEDIDPVTFRSELENSKLNNQEIQIEKYVQSFPSRKHELFLIPNGTVHSSGVNNMVLEISATPYIFTFKMYDWLSLDLNGKPRPINIEHAFNNLKFERKGDVVARELISQQAVIDEGEDWQLFHLPTHREHFYDVERIEFDQEMVIDTDQRCHVLMLVEGTSISVQVNNGESHYFNYAETFIIPAAAGEYKLINHGAQRAKVIKAFLKNNI